MTMALAYWVIWLVCLIFGVWSTWPVNRANGAPLAFFVLTFLLGWKVFGFIIDG